MKREDLKVGGIWKYKMTDNKYEILFIGEYKVFMKNLESGFECTVLITELTNQYTPIPKEPKPLGYLVVENKNGNLTVKGLAEIRISSSYTPVTINEKGEVFEIKE